MSETLRDLSEALPAPVFPVIHVEICQCPTSVLSPKAIRERVKQLFCNIRTVFGDIFLTEFEDPVLAAHVSSVAITDIPHNLQALDLSKAQMLLHIFRLNDNGPSSEEVDDDESVSAASTWLLPCLEFHGLWENLVFDGNTKLKLLGYAETTLLFSSKKVNNKIISWNRVILLHGPPGTGKTSLSKALAQKLCIRLSEKYSYGQLMEINSHSLFSKWFSESGKLVQKMFAKIQELIDDPEVFVCILIDEVESLTSARKSAMSGSEPSDAIRVVNALLTQIDQIKRFPNVLILTTSNVTGAIDLAFVDRADIKQYIGLPSAAAVFKIYQSCIRELNRVGIINPAQQILDLRALEVMRYVENDVTRLSLRLRDIARKSEGLSGRTLRKLPFLAHTLVAHQTTLSMDQFLHALEEAVAMQFAEREDLAKS